MTWDWRDQPKRDKDWQAAINERGSAICRKLLDAALARRQAEHDPQPEGTVEA